MTPFPLVTLIEAAAALGVTPGRLRKDANDFRDGVVGQGSLAARLHIQKLIGGRDWLIPRSALDAEVARRRDATGINRLSQGEPE